MHIYKNSVASCRVDVAYKKLGDFLRNALLGIMQWQLLWSSMTTLCCTSTTALHRLFTLLGLSICSIVYIASSSVSWILWHTFRITHFSCVL